MVTWLCFGPIMRQHVKDFRAVDLEGSRPQPLRSSCLGNPHRHTLRSDSRLIILTATIDFRCTLKGLGAVSQMSLILCINILMNTIGD